MFLYHWSFAQICTILLAAHSQLNIGEKWLDCGSCLEPPPSMISSPFGPLLGRCRDRRLMQRTIMLMRELSWSSTREPKSEVERKRSQEAGDSLDENEGIM